MDELTPAQQANRILYRALIDIATTPAFFAGEIELVAIAQVALREVANLSLSPQDPLRRPPLLPGAGPPSSR